MSEHFDVLVRASEIIEATKPASVAWKGSPFEWLKRLSPSEVGRVGEKMVDLWLSEMGLEVGPCAGREADLAVGPWRVEVKFSTLWRAGFYSFQQIRDQNYDYALFMGVSPFEAHAWFVPKGLLMSKWASGEIASQHAGKAGSDTAWIQVKPANVPDWLGACGGELGRAFQVIRCEIDQVPVEERRRQMALFVGALQEEEQSSFSF